MIMMMTLQVVGRDERDARSKEFGQELPEHFILASFKTSMSALTMMMMLMFTAISAGATV